MENTCPECLGFKDSLQDLCEGCIEGINKEEDRLDQEHEVIELSYYRSQLI